MLVTTPRMRPLLLSEVFPPQVGGSGRWLFEVYRRLPRRDVVVAAGKHPAAAEFDATHDLRIHRLPLSMPSWGFFETRGCQRYLHTARLLSRLIKSERPAA